MSRSFPNRKMLLFTISFIIPFVFYRIYVFLQNGKVSYLRGITGLQVHHYHYGVIFSLIGILLILFYKETMASVVISGLGAGMMLDGFLSSLMPSATRAEEIANYNMNFIPTLVLFVGVILLVMMMGRAK